MERATGFSLDDAHFEVLNAIVLKKFASAAMVADATGRPLPEVEQAMAALEADGSVMLANGQAMPTDVAEGQLAQLAAERCAALRADPGVERLHDRFEKLNRSFLQALTDWQQMPVGDRKVQNDHSDPAYDAEVISRVSQLVDRLGRICDELAATEPRFARYRERLTSAFARIDVGETDYVSSPMVDSVHNIWFEFHEDLLRTLGKEREE